MCQPNLQPVLASAHLCAPPNSELSRGFFQKWRDEAQSRSFEIASRVIPMEAFALLRLAARTYR